MVHDRVIGALIGDACHVSKLVLSAYKCEVKDETNVSTLSSNSFGLETLATCATYLGFSVFDVDGKKIFKNKVEVADRIVKKIKSYFSSTCSDCLESYHRTPKDPPSLRTCYRCFRGSHDCDTLKEKFKKPMSELEGCAPGIIWLCHGCLMMADATKLYGRKKVNSKVDNSQPAAESTAEGQDTLAEEVIEEEEEEEEELDLTKVKSEPPVKKPLVDDEDDDDAGFQTVSPNQLSDVCVKYRHGNCPHGWSGKRKAGPVKACSKQHPPVCWKFRKFGSKAKGGCKLGKKCTKFHPIVCKISASGESCTRRDCSRIHLLSAPKMTPGSQTPTHTGFAPNTASTKSNPVQNQQKRDSKLTVMTEKDFQYALLGQRDEFRREMKELRELVTSAMYPSPALYPAGWPQMGQMTAPKASPMTSTQDYQPIPQVRTVIPQWNDTFRI